MDTLLISAKTEFSLVENFLKTCSTGVFAELKEPLNKTIEKLHDDFQQCHPDVSFAPFTSETCEKLQKHKSLLYGSEVLYRDKAIGVVLVSNATERNAKNNRLAQLNINFIAETKAADCVHHYSHVLMKDAVAHSHDKKFLYDKKRSAAQIKDDFILDLKTGHMKDVPFYLKNFKQAVTEMVKLLPVLTLIEDIYPNKGNQAVKSLAKTALQPQN